MNHHHKIGIMDHNRIHGANHLINHIIGEKWTGAIGVFGGLLPSAISQMGAVDDTMEGTSVGLMVTIITIIKLVN